MKASNIISGLVALTSLFFLTDDLRAQVCTNTLPLIEDTLLCQPGPLPALELIANYTGNEPIVDFSWTPADRFDNPNSAQAIFDASTTTQVQLTIQSLSEELINNGDFSLGDVGFTSDYTFGNSMSSIGPLADEGQYRITKNPKATHSQYAPCTDHTSQDGNMMVVNGLGEPSNVWCQTVAIDPDTDYNFSAWVTSVVSQNPAQLQFSINDQLIGAPFTASSTLCSWQDFEASWNSAAATTAEICIANVNLSPAGNDFALDDISFRAVCTSTDSVTVNVVNSGTSEFTVPATLCQLDQRYVLDDFLAPTALSGGTWRLDNQPATEFNSGQLTLGAHELVYEINPGACLVAETRNFTIEAPLEAGAFALDPLELCLGTDLQSDILTTNLMGNDPAGSWLSLNSFPDSRLDPGTGQLDLDGAPAGTHAFAYVLPDNGTCPADSARVNLTLHPEIEIDLADEVIIDCFEPRATIRPTLRPIDNYTAEWFSTGAPSTPVATGVSFTTGQADVYRLAVTNPATGCVAEDFVTVTSQIADITLTVATDSLDCDVETDDGVLRVESVTGGTGPYLFSFNGAAFRSDSTYRDLSPSRGYSLVAQDINGCTDTVRYDFFDPADWTMEVVTEGNPIVNFGESVRLVVNTTLPTNRIDSLIWNPVPPNCESCLETVVRPDSITKYFVTIKNEYGCAQTDSVRVLIFIGKLIFTPSAFSPNDDGVNDIFTPMGGQGVDAIELLEVYSRWGELVYRGENLAASNLNEGWDGKIRGKFAPPGVYLFRTKVRLFDQRLFEFEGDLNLLR